MGVFCTWEELLTDLQILGCELHKKMRLADGLPRTRSRSPDPVAVIRGRERKGLGIGRGRKGLKVRT